MFTLGRAVAHPPTLAHVSVLRKGGPGIVVWILLAALYAASFRFCYLTAGEPYRAALEEQKELAKQARLAAVEASTGLDDETLDTGASDAFAVLDDGNDSPGLLDLELGIDAEAVAEDESDEDVATWEFSNDLQRRKMVGAIDAKTQEESGPLPSQYLPSFWACFSVAVLVTFTGLFALMHHWSINFRSFMEFRTTSEVAPNTFLKITPLKHQGKADIVPVEEAEISGKLSFVFQREKYEVLDSSDDLRDKLAQGILVASGSVVDGVQLLPTLCEMPIRNYIENPRGLISESQVSKALEKFGQNIFEVPLPTLRELYVSQLKSPVAVFQLFSSALWMLDEYWKYTMFTLVMILSFELATAFSRLKSLQTLRGMGNKPVDIYVYRCSRWAQIKTTDLLPGDLVSIKRTVDDQPGVEGSQKAAAKERAKSTGAASSGGTPVPCDCLVLKGSAVVNESSLTGESIPQLKDALVMPSGASQEDLERVLDIGGSDKVHCLFSGTLLLQHSATMSSRSEGPAAEGGAEASRDTAESALSHLRTPDDGCLCFVLRTGFSSSQGKLMRMIEYSTQKVSDDVKETAILLVLLFCFAVASSGYVLKKGLEDGKRSKYELMLRCVLILTSVVPPDLPMQTGLAVNTALMALMKAAVYCTEPHRIPVAGQMTHCLFDKTGTLTTDQLTLVGVVGNDQNNASTSTAEAKELTAVSKAATDVAVVFAGCHSLLEVDGKVQGDPIETAAVKAVRWQYNPRNQRATPLPLKPKMPEGTMIESGKARSSSTSGKTTDQGQQPPHLANMSVEVVHRHRFSSKLQRMATIVCVRSPSSTSTSLLGASGAFVLVKGSPEAIKGLLAEGSKPAWYEATYMKLAEQGMRVLALASKPCSADGSDTGDFSVAAAAAKRPREWAESNLQFVGFAAFACKTRSDSDPVIRSLTASSHKVSMITGDAPLTALHVAREVSIVTKDREHCLVLTDTNPGKRNASTNSLSSVEEKRTESDFEWRSAIDSVARPVAVPFSPNKMPDLANEYDLIVNGPVLEAVAAATDGRIWAFVEHIRVFSRMAPDGKARVIKGLNEKGYKSLMCGDGGNDVGALKEAHVGLALLSGFGNVNTEDAEGDKEERKPEKSAEDELEEKHKKTLAKAAVKSKLTKAQIEAKRKEIVSKQQEWLMEELEKLRQNGETGIGAQFKATKAIYNRVQTEMKKVVAEARGVPVSKDGNSVAASSARFSQLMGGEEMESGEVPMVKLGDASIAAPFTSKMPSVRATVDIIRQGRCTLVNKIQSQQILMLNCMISAYSLSALSLEGSRSSEAQMMATAVLLSGASFGFSFARPLDRMSTVRPIASVFHPALFVSILGQLAIHLGVMLYTVSVAKTLMGEEALQEAIRFQREADKEFDAGDMSAASKHKPNLLNTAVFLVETAQQVSVLGVNYKGRPWTKSVSENPALMYSLFACAAGIFAAASELIPELNKYLGLVKLPEEDNFKNNLLSLLVVSTVGAFVWDRICLAIFAPEVFKASLSGQLQWKEIWKSASKILLGVAGLTVVTLLNLNIMHLGMIYMAYRQYKKAQQRQRGGAPQQ